MSRVIGAALAMTLLASPVLCGERVDLTKLASATGVVEVGNVSGSITIVGWAREEVHVQGVLGRGTERLEFEAGPLRTVVRVVLPRNCRSCEGSDLTIKVPAASALEVNVVSADITVRDMTGTCALKSVNGDILVTGSTSQVDARAISGEVEVRVARAPVRAKSVSGDVVIDGVEGSVEGSSVSGSIRVKGTAISRADLAATSGSIRLEASVLPGARIEAKSVSGDITLVLPRGTVADFEVTTFSGGIRNDFGPAATRVSQYTSERELTFSTGSGGARIVLKSFSGNVALQKR